MARCVLTSTIESCTGKLVPVHSAGEPFGLPTNAPHFAWMREMNRPLALSKQKRIAALLCLLIIIPNSALAKDLELLAMILSGPFLGQQGIAICSTGDVPFSSEELSTISALNSHANYMKSRVTESLSRDEEIFVLREAADRAKAQMTQVVQLLKSNSPDVEQAKRIKWCKENLTALANKTIAVYEQNREQLEAVIVKAKNH
jgi:hypothetical protein